MSAVSWARPAILLSVTRSSIEAIRTVVVSSVMVSAGFHNSSNRVCDEQIGVDLRGNAAGRSPRSAHSS